MKAAMFAPLSGSVEGGARGVASRSSRRLASCMAASVFALQVGAAWLATSGMPYPWQEDPSGSAPAVDAANCTNEKKDLGRRGLEEIASSWLGEDEFAFYRPVGDRCRQRAKVTSVEYKWAYHCSAAARIRDFRSCSIAGRSKGAAFAKWGTEYYAFYVLHFEERLDRNVTILKYSRESEPERCRVATDRNVTRLLTRGYSPSTYKPLGGEVFRALLNSWESFENVSDPKQCLALERESGLASRAGVMFRAPEKDGTFSCGALGREVSREPTWNCTAALPFDAAGNMSTIFWNAGIWNLARSRDSPLKLANSSGCQLGHLELCFVLPVERKLKMLVLVAALVMSATIACVIGGGHAPEQRAHEDEGSEFRLGSSRLAAETLLGWTKLKCCNTFRLAQITRFLIALVLNLHEFRPFWILLWYIFVYAPFGLYLHGVRAMLAKPLAIFFPLRGLFERMRRIDAIYFFLNLLDAAPFLLIDMGDHDMFGPSFMPTMEGLSRHMHSLGVATLLNNLAKTALGSQAFGAHFLFALKKLLYASTTAYFTLALVVMFLPNDTDKIVKELPLLAKEIEAAAMKRLEQADEGLKPSASFPAGVKPVVAWKELWKGGPKFVPGILVKCLAQFLMDIITDTYAWVLFLHHHDYFFAGLLATVSWLATFVQMRQGLWGRMADEFQTSSACGVLTHGWIHLLDIEKGMEAVLSSMVQLYAFLFAGFRDLPTALFTTFSIALSIKGLTDYLVDKVDLDPLSAAGDASASSDGSSGGGGSSSSSDVDGADE